MAKVKSEETKTIDRLHRIAGQIQGIERMVKEKRRCLAIIQQIIAVRSALAKVEPKFWPKSLAAG